MGKLGGASKRAGVVALGVWFAAMLLIGAALLAKHTIALPVPQKEAQLAASMAHLRPAGARDHWLAVHVLYSECRCSRRVADHLLATDRPAGWDEVVLWVGGEPPPSDLEHRFDVRRLRTEELTGLGIEAAPLLVAVDPSGRVRYTGGYTRVKQGPVIDDLRILGEARAEAQGAGTVAALPVLGCAVSDRLKRALTVFPAL